MTFRPYLAPNFAAALGLQIEEKKPQFADAHFNLARTSESAGRKEQARKHWRIYPELDPSTVWAHFIRGRLKDYDKAPGAGRMAPLNHYRVW